VTKQSRIQRLRSAHPWFDHLVRAAESYGEHYGNHYAAAITYFSVLSLIPILMVAFAVAGFVLAGNTHLLDQLQADVAKSVPGQLGSTFNKMISGAIEARGTVGVVGLLVALYSGVGWMGNLRDALTAQWGQERPKLPILRTMLRDLVALVGLGLAIVISFAITAAGTGLGTLVLRWAGLDHIRGAHGLLIALTVVVAVLANWLVFLWVIAKLPRERVGLRSAVRGALIAAIGFEAINQLATVLLRNVGRSPTATIFGSALGLLTFANIVSRFLLLVTAWTATAKENVLPAEIPAPPPVVISPVVAARDGFGSGVVTGLVAGTAAGLALRRRR
jgi:membrane protein